MKGGAAIFAVLVSVAGAQNFPRVSSGLLPSYTASDTNGATSNTANQNLQICPGETTRFLLCDHPSASCGGDTYLRLVRASDGITLNENDDARNENCGYCSILEWTNSDWACVDVVLQQGYPSPPPRILFPRRACCSCVSLTPFLGVIQWVRVADKCSWRS
jgi:hypothetical protein